jgi:glutamate mutase epsilon subunit
VPAEVLEYHREKLAGRAKKEGRPLDFKMVVDDLQFAATLPN